jgi:succinoglycan biosynthesis transport protein ExoP
MTRQVGRYVRLARQWWWLLVLSAIIPAALTKLLLSRQPDVYRARATLVVGSTLQSTEPDPWQVNVANTLANAYARLATEGPVTQAVIDRLDLERRPDRLADQIVTRVYPEAQLVEIMVVDSNPVAAALIANALAEELVRRSPISQEDQAQRQTFIRSQMDDLEARIEQLDAEITILQASFIQLTSAAELEEARNRLIQLETAKADLQATYASLLASYQSELPNVVSLFDPAVEPPTPLPRRDNLIMVTAAAAGLFLAAAGIVLIEYFDDAVQWEGEHTQSLLGMPVLGAVARMPARGSPITEGSDPLSPSAEMVRVLRTNIFLAASERPLATVLLTSPNLAEGKTFTVAHLGLAIVGGGRRVVMVDADLRRPALHELFDLPNVYGLSDLLADHTPFADTDWPKGTLETGVKDLHLIPAGPPPVDPSLLLTHPRLRELIDVLKKQADIVLLDSPPELVGPDSSVLASVADGTVLVARAGVTSYRQILRVRDRLAAREGVNLLGVAVNEVKIGGNSYYSYRYYASDRRRRQREQRFWRDLWRRLPFAKHDSSAAEGNGTLDLAETAEYLGVSRATARRWCSTGRIPATRSWFRWRIKTEDLHTAMPRIAREETT